MTLQDAQGRHGERGSAGPTRLGVVSFLNAKPLIAGLDADPTLELIFDVPARLPSMLEEERVDAALVPVIDLASPLRPWRIVSDACIGCDGETLTVRVFSRVPPSRVRRLHVDGDSHTSVVLAQVIWREMHGRRLDILPWTGRESLEECEAVLLIGDKVVTHRPIDYEVETDLGSAWKSLTGLPFVFAVWAAKAPTPLGDLPARLRRARDLGIRSAAMIAEDYGPGMGWPTGLARRYLTTRLKFTMGEREWAGMNRFLQFVQGPEGLLSHREAAPA